MAQSKDLKKVLFEKKTFPLSSIKNIELTTTGGSIYAEGTSSGEAILEVYVASGNGRSISLEDAKSIIATNYEYETGLNGSTLFAKTKHKGKSWSNKNSVSISYKVIVPIQTSSSIATSGGSIQIQNLKGTENITTSGGSLDIEKVDGRLNANTSGGSITLKQSSGNLRVVTSGGSINMDGLNGDIKAATSGGSINANSISGSLSAQTSGGSITLKNIAGTTDASTSGGSINGTFTDPGKGIKLVTSAGGINIHVPKNKGYDLQLNGDHVNISNTTLQGTITKTYINAKSNGGGIPLKASTSAGSVSVSMD
ncbi:MAG: hypothetical protein DI598_15680 [Pseudopedobacter saltans]|uniref:Adhesin domain-containing protein n=1 Tax=Pseudopedobacter saltans TaxID=151895 RepID=A0A2W5GD26_9SPHI|nr:MAG: hypothetical protein DI598_15680 [Pseudopedobacter saltans]